MKKFLCLAALSLMGSWTLASAQEVVVADSIKLQENVLPSDSVLTAPADSLIAAPADSVDVVAPVDSPVVEEEPAVPAKPVYEYPEDDPEYVAMQHAMQKKDFATCIAKTWEYQLNAVFNTSVAHDTLISGDESGAIEIGLGYNFTNRIYLGISTGFYHDFGAVEGCFASDYIPFFGVAQFRYPLFRRLHVYAALRAGVLVATYGDIERAADNGRPTDITFEYPNYLYYEFQPGFLIRATKNLDIRLAVAYGFADPYNETRGLEQKTHKEHVISIKAGISRRFDFKNWTWKH